MQFRTALAAAVLLAVVYTSACGGSGTEITVREPDSPPQTGIPELDDAVDAALRTDTLDLAGRTGYQRIGCVAEPENAPTPPTCRGEESAGDRVEAFPVLRCGLEWLRPEVVPDAYAAALGESPALVAAYRPVSRPLVLNADYVAVFDTSDGDREAGVALAVRAGRVISIEHACDEFDRLYADEKVREFIVSPDEGEPGEEDRS